MCVCVCVCVCAPAHGKLGSTSLVRTNILFALFATHRFTMPKATKQAMKKTKKATAPATKVKAMKRNKDIFVYWCGSRARDPPLAYAIVQVSGGS